MTSYTQLARNLGGDRSWSFNQLMPGQLWMRLFTKTIGGICWATTMEWIIGEENGKPLKDSLGSDFSLNSDAYKALIAMQRNTPAQSQVQASLLASKCGVAIKATGASNGKLKLFGATRSAGLAKYLSSNYPHNYVLIKVKKRATSSGGHVFAAKLPKTGDLKFFDSNEGEFTFDQSKRQNFCLFVGQYMEKAYSHQGEWWCYQGSMKNGGG
ncbi:MAG: hypothetical protein AAGD13_22115 [Pseudomonadota bacterium]